VNKQVQRMDKLPSTGSGTPTTILTLITAITIGTLLLTLRRRLLHK
jgi:LPXTG-motif cell wall-anchored protein